MRLILQLVLLWPCLCLEPALANNAEPTQAAASAMTGVGSGADASDWDAVTGQEWLVQALDGRPVLDGTAITIVFDRAGRVSGNAGTNRFVGAYQRTGSQSLAVSKLGATKMYLDVPSGRMQQETTYLDLLQSVERFTLEDDQLTLWAEGERSIRYSRAP